MENSKSKNIILKLFEPYHYITATTTLIILVVFASPQFKYLKLPELNSIASKNYSSNKEIRFIDVYKTKEQKLLKQNLVIPYLKIDYTVKFDENYFKPLYKKYNQKIFQKLFQKIIYKGVLKSSPPFKSAKVLNLTVIKDAGESRIKNQFNIQKNRVEILFGKENLVNYINAFLKKNKIKITDNEVDSIAGYFIKNANVLFDNKRYLKEKELIVQTTPPIVKIIKKGTIIIKKGEKVTFDKIKLLKKLRLYSWESDFKVVLGILVLFSVFLGFYYLFIYFFYKNIFYNLNKFVLSSLLLVLPVGLLKIFLFFMTGSQFIHKIYNVIFILPFPVFFVLTAVLLRVRLSIVQNFVVSILISFVYTISLYTFSEIFNYFNILLLLVIFISSSVGVLSYVNIIKRLHLVRSGIITGVVGCLIIFFFSLATSNIKSGYPSIKFLAYISMLLNGFLLTPILTIGLLPFFETLFKITTNYKLLELSDLNLRVFKDMLVKAPGTYQHSIVVGNLAESAAELVGANPLLARAGAYYHDMGKMKKPEYFIENQPHVSENIHEKIKPTLSSSIIKSHVKIGLDMAKELKLPQEIQDIIQQHHGTSIIKIFYKQALEEAGENDVILEEDFRYPGPNPKSKEAAIVLLTDVVEAACRSLPNPTPARLEETIHDCITSRILEGALDECNLTLNEIKIIEKTFLQIITTLYHSRMKYPDESEIKILQQQKK